MIYFKTSFIGIWSSNQSHYNQQDESFNRSIVVTVVVIIVIPHPQHPLSRKISCLVKKQHCIGPTSTIIIIITTYFFHPPASLNFRNGEIITNLKLSSKTSTVLAQFTRVIEISFKDEDTAANML